MQNAKAQRRAVAHRNAQKYNDKPAPNTLVSKIWSRYIKAMETLLQLEGMDASVGATGAIKKLKEQIKSYRTILKREGQIK